MEYEASLKMKSRYLINSALKVNSAFESFPIFSNDGGLHRRQ